MYIVRNKNQAPIENGIAYSEDNGKQYLYEIKGKKFLLEFTWELLFSPLLSIKYNWFQEMLFIYFLMVLLTNLGGPSGKKLKYNQFKKVYSRIDVPYHGRTKNIP